MTGTWEAASSKLAALMGWAEPFEAWRKWPRKACSFLVPRCCSCVVNWGPILFFPVLRRNHWHASLCQRTAYCMIVWFTYDQKRFPQHPFSHTDTIKGKERRKEEREKFFFLWWQLLESMLRSSPGYHTTALAVYFTTRNCFSCDWKFIPFDCLSPISPPLPPTSSNHKSDFFFHKFSFSYFVSLFFKFHM